MIGYRRKTFPGLSIQFNVTPLLDVVLLLVIFFMLVCDFIRRETFPLTIPDNCPQARSADPTHADALTVSIFPVAEGVQSAMAMPHSAADPTAVSTTSISRSDVPVIYAVRDIQFNPQDTPYRDNPDLLISDISAQIKRLTSNNPAGMVHLRAHRDLPYGQVQTFLIALSHAGVQKVQFAAQRNQ
jgi:biopolymer transport protein ExbD